MRDGEWQLVYTGTSLTWGPADLPIINLSAPDLADPELSTDDASRPRADGVAFGTDYRGGRTITFDLGLMGDDEAEVRDTLATLSTAWRADAVRSKPGAVAELHVQYAGRERVIYGRPRRFAATDEEAYQGWITAAADFATADDLFYGASEGNETLTIIPPTGGGLVAPLASPLTSTASSDRSASITVGGQVNAWPIVTFAGPITNPEFAITGLWSLKLATTLAADQSLTIDTRPWARTVLRDGVASLAGALTRDSVRLAGASIPPGTYEVVLRGTDGTGTASMSVRWRETFTAL